MWDHHFDFRIVFGGARTTNQMVLVLSRLISSPHDFWGPFLGGWMLGLSIPTKVWPSLLHRFFFFVRLGCWWFSFEADSRFDWFRAMDQLELVVGEDGNAFPELMLALQGGIFFRCLFQWLGRSLKHWLQCASVAHLKTCNVFIWCNLDQWGPTHQGLWRIRSSLQWCCHTPAGLAWWFDDVWCFNRTISWISGRRSKWWKLSATPHNSFWTSAFRRRLIWTKCHTDKQKLSTFQMDSLWKFDNVHFHL